MNVMFVSSSLTGGGAERVISVIANEFSKIPAIDNITLVSIIEDKVSYELNKQIKYIPYKGINENKLIRVIKRFSFLRKTIIKEKPDVIISFATQVNIYSIVANLGLKTKVIISERNDPNRDPIQSTVRKIRDQVYKLCDGAVFQTTDAMNYFEKVGKFPRTVILNPLKANLPEPYEGIRESRIVTVARLHPAKNLPLLISSFKNIIRKFPNLTLEIYGEGKEKNHLIELVKTKGITERVFFKGFSNSIHNDINAAACFVLSSNYEGMSNAMLESLALGIPTICTDCPIGGARMVIDHMENGLLFPVGNQEKLEQYLELILEDFSLREKFKENSIKIRERLSSEKISKQWFEFVKLILTE
ncbi:TPA: glycosyltransferase [Streptococcus suis]